MTHFIFIKKNFVMKTCKRYQSGCFSTCMQNWKLIQLSLKSRSRSSLIDRTIMQFSNLQSIRYKCCKHELSFNSNRFTICPPADKIRVWFFRTIWKIFNDFKTESFTRQEPINFQKFPSIRQKLGSRRWNWKFREIFFKVGCRTSVTFKL